jgi:hypothetical protein
VIGAAELLGSLGLATGVLIQPAAIGLIPGPDPERRSYVSFATFNDPDGNSWVFQEIRERLPGRGSTPPQR